jgi:hypothetical protein
MITLLDFLTAVQLLILVLGVWAFGVSVGYYLARRALEGKA